MTPSTEQRVPARRGKTPPPREPLDRNKVVDACIQQAGGRTVDAANLLQGLAEEDDELFRLLMEDGLRLRCYNLVKDRLAAKNKSIRDEQDRPRPMPATIIPSPGSDRRAKEIAKAAQRSSEREERRLSDMTIWGAGILSSATFAQVSVAREHYQKLADTNGITARFLGLIEPLGRGEQLVGRICNEAQLVRLYTSAKEAV